MSIQKRGHLIKAAALAVAFAVLYFLTRQRGIYGDGILFVGNLLDGEMIHNHILYLPATHLLRALLSPFVQVPAEDALRLLSILSAGGAVGLTFLVARAVLRRTWPAFVAACLLGVLQSFWFFATSTEIHSLCTFIATLFLYGLVRALIEGEDPSRSWRWLILLGAALTPASHNSGVIILMPALCAALLSRRWSVFLYAFLGFMIYASVFGTLIVINEGLRNYWTNYSGTHLGLLARPWLIPGMLKMLCIQLVLFSVPASTLAPLGGFVLFRRSRNLCLFFLSWLFAWPLIAFPVGAQVYGSYYVPTLSVQVIFAVLALQRLGRTPWLGTLIALAPGPVLLYSETAALVVYAIASASLFALSRESAERSPARLLSLPVAGLILTSLCHVPQFFEDPTRDQIREVRAFTEQGDLVFLIEPTPKYYQYKRFWFDECGVPDNLINLVPLELLDDVRAGARLKEFLNQVRARIRDGRAVYLAGTFEKVGLGKWVPRFFDALQSEYGLYSPLDAPPGLLGVGMESLSSYNGAKNLTSHGVE